MHLMLCVYDYITETVTICKLKLLGARLCISLGVLLLVLDHLWLLIYSIGVHASLKYVTSLFNFFLLVQSVSCSNIHIMVYCAKILTNVSGMLPEAIENKAKQ